MTDVKAFEVRKLEKLMTKKSMRKMGIKYLKKL